MTMQLGSQTIVQGKTGFFNAPTTGLKGLIISNESPYTLSVIVGIGLPKTLNPETIDFFPTGRGFNGNVTYTPTNVLLNPTAYTASTIAFDAVGTDENIDISVYPLALTRQAVTTTATGKPIFSATVAFGNTLNLAQFLNIFNPANSGTIMTFHSARVTSNDATVPTAFINFTNGADNNLAGTVSLVSHTIVSNPPVSVGHGTFADGAGPGTVVLLESLPMIANAVIDFTLFPDEEKLYPGNNITLSVHSTVTGKIVSLTLKWTEDTIVPPIAVTGAKAVASSIQNDGSPLGTQWLEITPSSQGSSAIISTVDGQLTWKVVSGGVYHQALRIANAANFLQLGQAGDTVEALGNLIADGHLSINTNNTTLQLKDTGGTLRDILWLDAGNAVNLQAGANGGHIFLKDPQTGVLILDLSLASAVVNGLLAINGSTNPTIDISAATGATGVKLQGGFSISGKHPATLAGGTSGNADMYELFTGAVKVIIVLLNNFRTGASNQSIVFPTTFTNRATIIARDSEAFQLMLTGVAQANRQITAFGAAASTAGTTIANTVMTGENWFWLNTGFDTLQFNSGWTAAHGGIYLIVGT